ncbi:MAG TPA: LapA family protein [Actinotalea sp.]
MGICIGALVCAALIIFMLQNTDPVEVTFLGMSGTAPLALTLLIAGVGVGGIALVIGSLRIGQLRRRIAAERAATVQATDRAAARAPDRSADRAADRGTDRAAGRAADRAADRGTDRVTPPAGPSVP